MRKRFALAVIALLLGLAAGGYYFFGKVDEVTVLYGTVRVEMNYTTDHPLYIREKVLSTPHCPYHSLENGKLVVKSKGWDKDITIVLILDYFGDYRDRDGIGSGQWVQVLERPLTLDISASMNTNLALYHLKPSIESYNLEPIRLMENLNGTWITTYEVHSGNQTYSVTESLSLESHPNISVYLKRFYSCE